MPPSQVAEIFRKIADLLEIKGENPFRVRAYRRGADAIEGWDREITADLSLEVLRTIPGIGEDLATKAREIARTGTTPFLAELEDEVPEGVVRMLDIPTVGPKSAKLFYESLKVRTLEDLEQAARSGRLLSLPGIKEKTVENILKGIELVRQGQERMDLLSAERASGEVLDVLQKMPGVKTAVAAGSLRRLKETIGDIDILVSARDPESVLNALSGHRLVRDILAKGPTKVSVRTQGGVQVDVRGVVPGVFGAAWIYFTGSQAHNIRLRALAVKKGWKVNEYGLFDGRGRVLGAKTEEDVYRRLGLGFIEPELREDQGEIESALEDRLPDLVRIDDIRGDLHAHTTYSDGASTLEEMARAADDLGREYLCLTDHSVSLHVAHGLDEKRLREKRLELDRVNKKLKRCRLLFGAEVEIDAEGNLDYAEDVLASFDVVIAAVHSGFKQSKAQLTRRLVKACENKHVHLIAHPTGRFWPTRPAYDVDMEEVMRHARDTGTALEINSHPTRLDLKDVHARRAAELGVKVAVNTDSHHASQLAYMRFGVGVARRGWLTKADVLNTRGLKMFLKAIKS